MSKRSESPPEDGDSTMHDNSPPSLSDREDPSSTEAQLGRSTPLTPTQPLREQAASALSPPDSQSKPREMDIPTMSGIGSTTMPSSSKNLLQETLNANGKREYSSKGPGGYTWEKEEDAPGYSWMNKKAQDEMARALTQIVDFDQQIKMRYGDVLEPTGDGRGK